MARNNGSRIKWTMYSAVFLLFFFFETCVFNRFPLFGAVPVIAPVLVALTALFEGAFTGSVFGLLVGFYCAVVYYHGGIYLIPACTVIGMLAGCTTNKQIGRNLLGGILCSIGAVILSEGLQVFIRNVFYRDSLDALLHIAVPEGIYSLLFLLPIYWAVRTVYRRFRTDSKL